MLLAKLLRRCVAGVDGQAAGLAEKVLHRPVFEGMEADDCHHTPGSELRKGRREGALDGSDLVVDGYADALKGTGGGMNAALAFCRGRDGVSNELRQGRGALERT